MVLDLESIERGGVVAVREALVGRRNITLHRQALEFVRCGIDPNKLVPPAIGAELDEAEARTVVNNAKTAFSAERSESVLAFVLRWLDYWRPGTDDRLHPLLSALANAAVSQNSRSPFFAQDSLDLGIHQTSVSRRFTALHERGLIERKSRGMGPMGRRPNYYKLLLPDG